MKHFEAIEEALKPESLSCCAVTRDMFLRPPQEVIKNLNMEPRHCYTRFDRVESIGQGIVHDAFLGVS